MSESTGKWVPVYTTGIEYEAELVCDRLNDSGINAVIQNKRDHAFNLTVGDLANIAVMVQEGSEEEARALLASAPVSDSELTRQALHASPLDPEDRALAELDDDASDDETSDDD